MSHLPRNLPNSLWAATACPAPAYADKLPASPVDVAVIGGGYTGLSAALHLAQRGKRVVVIEAAEPGWGGSGRNGGQIIAGLKASIAELSDIFGPDLGARTAINMGSSADLLYALVEKYNMDCHTRRTGWVQAAHGPKPYRDIVVPRYQQWSGLGVGAKLLTRAEVAAAVGSVPNAYFAAWSDPRGGVLQPLSYARGLAAAAMREGAVIVARTLVTELRHENGVWNLATSRGDLRAAEVIMATNAYTGAHQETLLPGLTRAFIPVTSFQMATKPLESRFDHLLRQGFGVTDSRRLLVYFRRDHTGRLVMGSRSPVEDNPTPDHARQLQRMIRYLFPELGMQAPEFVWSGKVAITKDRLPHIHLPAKGLTVFLGCNGRGVAMCTMMGKLLADIAGGTPVADVPFPVTAPDTFALHRLRKLGIFALSQYYRLLDTLESAARG